MILQNISKAIREQNYYAVALEFVIVIAGVVIGFQINAWAQDREAVVRAQALTVRLSDDLAMERLNIVDTLTYYAVVMENANAVAADLRGDEALADGSTGSQDPPHPRIGSAPATWTPCAAKPRTPPRSHAPERPRDDELPSRLAHRASFWH